MTSKDKPSNRALGCRACNGTGKVRLKETRGKTTMSNVDFRYVKCPVCSYDDDN